ncbi:MAG: hypothetical protein ACFBSE_23465 [Prochloraceae cyanobacterium]
MESVKLKQLIYLCATSCTCGLVFGLVVHENWKDVSKMGLAAVVSSVAATWVVKREDLQEKFESGIVEASYQVKSNIDKVKEKIQNRSNSAKPSRKAIASVPPRKALPEQQRPSSPQVANPVSDRELPRETIPNNFIPETPQPATNKNIPPETIEPDLPQLEQPQPENEEEYDSLVGQLHQLQEKNSGLKNQLQELQQQNQTLQTQLKLSDEQRQEWNQALESLDEQSEMFVSKAGGEQVGLEDLLDNVPPLSKQQSSPKDKANSLNEENEFDEALTQFSKTLQTEDNFESPQQQQTTSDLPPEGPLKPRQQQQQQEAEEFPDELAMELDDIVGEDSSIKKSSSQVKELDYDDLPSELADELEDMMVEEPKNKSDRSVDSGDLLAQLSEDFQLPEDSKIEANKSILSEEQTELEQLFGQTPDDSSSSDRKKES